MWRSTDNFEKSVFTFHHYMGSGNQTQVTKLDCRLLFLLSHLVSPYITSK